MKTIPWYQRLPKRLLAEEQALLSLYDGDAPLISRHRWTQDDSGAVILFVTLRLPSIELEIHFPRHYPDECPNVRPTSGDILSTHQYVKSTILCLELLPDNWHPYYMAVDLVRSAARLLAGETLKLMGESIEIPSRHVETWRPGGMVLVRTKAFDERAQSATSDVEFEFVWSFRGPIKVTPAAFPKGEKLKDSMPGARHGTAVTGKFIVLREGAPEIVPTKADEFKSYVNEHSDGMVEEHTCILLKWAKGRTRAFICFDASAYELQDLLVEADAGSRVEDDLRSLLASTRIGIVGLGSLGSKVAVTLARTGARRFVLVDDDVLLGPNICRHAADYRDIGMYKVKAVRELICDVSLEDPDVTAHVVDVASATNPEVHARVLADLAKCDVLIDATANADVFCILAMIASDHRYPMAWAEVFAGGIGGLVASGHPNTTPCPRCVRAGFHAKTNAWETAPRRKPGAPYAGGDEEPVVATDADVGYIAAALAHRVLTLVRGDASELPAVHLFGMARTWIFEHAMQTIPVSVRSDDYSCPRCWRPAAEADPSSVAAATELFVEPVHADDSSSL